MSETQEQVKDRQKLYVAEHAEQVRSYQRAYVQDVRAKDPLRQRLHVGACRARQAGSLVDVFSPDDLEKFWLANGINSQLCYYTGVELGSDFHLDHKTPLSRGGEHTLANLVPCSPFANIGKKNKTESEYRQFLARKA